MSEIKCILISHPVGNFLFISTLLCIVPMCHAYMQQVISLMHFQQHKTFVDEIIQGPVKKSAKAYEKVLDDFEAFWRWEVINLFSV